MKSRRSRQFRELHVLREPSGDRRESDRLLVEEIFGRAHGKSRGELTTVTADCNCTSVASQNPTKGLFE